MSRPDLAASDSTQFDDKGREDFSRSDSGSTKDDFLGVTGLSFQDKGWISPPDSIYSSSLESDITSGEASLADSSNNPAELLGQHSRGPNQREETYLPNSLPSSQTDFQEISDSGRPMFNHLEMNNSDSGSVKSIIDEANEYHGAQELTADETASVPVGSSQPLNKDLEVKFSVKDEVPSVNTVKIEEENNEDAIRNTVAVNRAARGKYKILLYLNHVLVLYIT